MSLLKLFCNVDDFWQAFQLPKHRSVANFPVNLV